MHEEMKNFLSTPTIRYLPATGSTYSLASEGGDGWPVVKLTAPWEEHYRRMLTMTFSQVKRLVEVDPPDKFYPPRTRATEATWRNFVYADSERIFLEDVELEVECGSSVQILPSEVKLARSKPDFSLGVARHAFPQFSACGTGRIAIIIVDAEDKRDETDKSDECKLLCVMAARLRALKQTCFPSLDWAHHAKNGVPLMATIGILRSATLWSAYLMWGYSTRAICVTPLVSNSDMANPEQFLHYTTFMHRLYCYMQLYKQAVQEIQDEHAVGPDEGGPGSNMGDGGGDGDGGGGDGDGDGDGDGGDSGDGDGDSGGDGDGDSGGNSEGEGRGDGTGEGDRDTTGSKKGKEKHSGSTEPSIQVQESHLEENRGITVLENLGVNYVAVLLCKRVDGSLVIIKEGFVDYELQAEIQAYKLLETHGITPKLLGYWSSEDPYQHGMELEYVPSLDQSFQPAHPGHLIGYMKGLLKALACMHQLGLVHRDIKCANVLVWHTPKDDQVHVKLIDFQVS